MKDRILRWLDRRTMRRRAQQLRRAAGALGVRTDEDVIALNWWLLQHGIQPRPLKLRVL